MSDFISRTEAGQRLCVSPQTIDRLIRYGQLRHIKVGRRVAIFADSLADYVSSITDGVNLIKESK
jgi:excisionase family DNA binding protein